MDFLGLSAAGPRPKRRPFRKWDTTYCKITFCVLLVSFLPDCELLLSGVYPPSETWTSLLYICFYSRGEGKTFYQSTSHQCTHVVVRRKKMIMCHSLSAMVWHLGCICEMTTPLYSSGYWNFERSKCLHFSGSVIRAESVFNRTHTNNVSVKQEMEKRGVNLLSTCSKSKWWWTFLLICFSFQLPARGMADITALPPDIAMWASHWPMISNRVRNDYPSTTQTMSCVGMVCPFLDVLHDNSITSVCTCWHRLPNKLYGFGRKIVAIRQRVNSCMTFRWKRDGGEMHIR